MHFAQSHISIFVHIAVLFGGKSYQSGFDKSDKVKKETVKQPCKMYKHTDSEDFIHFQILYCGKKAKQDYKNDVNERKEERTRFKKQRIPYYVENNHYSKKEASLIFIYLFTQRTTAENGTEAKSQHKIGKEPDKEKHPCRRKHLFHTDNMQNGQRASRKKPRKKSGERNTQSTRNYGDSVYLPTLKAGGRENKSFFLQHKSPHN